MSPGRECIPNVKVKNQKVEISGTAQREST